MHSMNPNPIFQLHKANLYLSIRLLHSDHGLFCLMWHNLGLVLRKPDLLHAYNNRADQSVQGTASRTELVIKNEFSYFLTKTYVVGAQKNRLNETVLMSIQNIGLN